MENSIQFFSQFNEFLAALFSMLEDSDITEILISGIWDAVLYRKIVESIVSNSHTDKMKIIIPNVLSKGTLQRPMINKIVRLGGRVNVNSSFGNNLIVIDNSVFIASYSYKHSKEYGPRSVFESCLLTKHENTISEIKKLFMNKWNQSFPLSIEDVQGDNV